MDSEERLDQSAEACPSGAHSHEAIRLTRDGSVRTVVVTSACPPAMQRAKEWAIGDYELHKQLYKGKASVLYSATCKQSGVHVALKLYRKPRLSDLNWFQVTREITIHACLRHAHIIDFYASFEDADNVYLVQEFAYGGDLFGELKRCGGRFKDKNVARDVVRPCLLALRYCHQKGIIHRDIKPENILLTKHKQIKLADFGLSIDATRERPVTRAGTLDYMAPEVLVCPEKSRPEENKDKALLTYTHAVDIWAMGILAFECLSGKPPFERQSRTETYEYIMYRRQQCPTYFSQEAVDFVHHALSKAAGKRTPIAELLEHTWIMQYTPAPTEARISAFRGHASLALPTSPASASSPDAASPTPGLSAQASATKISVPDSLAQTIRPKEREVKQAESDESLGTAIAADDALKRMASSNSVTSMVSAASWTTVGRGNSDAASALSSAMSTQLSLLGPSRDLPERAASAALPGGPSLGISPANSLRSAGSGSLPTPAASPSKRWKFNLRQPSSQERSGSLPSPGSPGDALDPAAEKPASIFAPGRGSAKQAQGQQ